MKFNKKQFKTILNKSTSKPNKSKILKLKYNNFLFKSTNKIMNIHKQNKVKQTQKTKKSLNWKTNLRIPLKNITISTNKSSTTIN